MSPPGSLRAGFPDWAREVLLTADSVRLIQPSLNGRVELLAGGDDELMR
jgi:hypothetical protein